MSAARPRVPVLLMTAGLGAIAALTLSGPATAAPVSGLTFLPAHGLASTPMTLLVPAACPAEGTNVVAQAFGYGFPATGQPVVTNSTAGVSHAAPFALPLQDTFTGFAADNGTKLSGPYRVTLRCINRLGNKTYASFTGTVTFSDAAHFSAPAPPDALVKRIEQAQQPTEPPVPTAAGSQPAGTAPSLKGSTKQGSAGGNPAGTNGSTATGGISTTATANQRAGKKSSFPWQPLLVVGAFLLIGLGILLRIREIRGNRRRDQSRLKPATDVSKSSTDSTSASAKSRALTGSGTSKNHGKGHHS